MIEKIPNNWDNVEIQEIAQVNIENLGEIVDPKKQYFYIELSDVNKGKIEIPVKKIEFIKLPSRARRVLHFGDVIMATVRPNLLGYALCNFNPEDILCSTGFALISPNDSEDSQYIYHSLYCDQVQMQLNGLITGSSYPAINSSDVKRLRIPYPIEKSERSKIAEILSTWDDAILKTELLIAAMQKRKKGLMQRLLTGQERFPGFNEAWKGMELGQILKPITRKVEKPKDGYLRLGVKSHGKGTFTSTLDDEDSNAVSMTHLYEVKEGDLIVSITFAWEGAIAIVGKDGDGALVSHRFPTFTFDNKKVLPEFFRYAMLTRRFFYDLKLISPGGAGRNRVMNKTDFLKLKIKVPSLNEQKKIGSILVANDEYINVLSKKLGLLQQQKKGLMQKLLTGEIRVNG